MPAQCPQKVLGHRHLTRLPVWAIWQCKDEREETGRAKREQDRQQYSNVLAISAQEWLKMDRSGWRKIG